MPRYRQGNWPWLAIGGLVLLNAVLLVALVARQPTVAVPTAVPLPGASSSAAGPSTAPAPRLPTSPSPAASRPAGPAQQPVPPASRVLAVASERLGWRAVVGGCRDEAVVEVTTDGGRTWRRTEPGMAAVSRLKSYRQQSVFAVGANRRCRPGYAWQQSADAGWRRSAPLAADIWFRLPADRDQVHAPGGRRSTPCPTGLADLAGLGTFRAAALCRDGRVRTTQDGGRWATVLRESGGKALNADDTEFVVARVAASCPGLVVQRFDAAGRGLGDASPRCRRAVRPSAPVAVAISGSTTWLWSGNEVEVF